MYYPKSRILENQYTSGKQLVTIGDFKEYIGYYHTISNGDKFTGKIPGTNSNKLIEMSIVRQIPENKEYDNVISDKIDILKIKFQKFLPKYNTKPTLSDYENGYVDRYFAQIVNSGEIIEINKTNYDSVINKDGVYYDIYKLIQIKWLISGDINDVVKTNFNTVSLNTLTLSNLPKILYNYTQFYKNKF